MKSDKVALCSVSDKSGLDKLCQSLTNIGWKLLASGGTASYIRDCGHDVIEVSDYTGSPEVMGGRVKTLHPAIHAGILARDNASDCNELETNGWYLIDMVIVNLYRFQDVVADPQATLESAVENIDIGGVALLRAGAKNFQRCTIVSSPDDYDLVIDRITNDKLDIEIRKSLAIKAFNCSSEYDRAIFNYMNYDETYDARAYHVDKLGYGENPHQKGALYSWNNGGGPLDGKVHDGKAISYNNVLDMDNAVRVLRTYKDTTAVIMKHNAPCGIATRKNIVAAINDAIECDPTSAFGSVVGVNRTIDVDAANTLKGLFVECVVAPGYHPKALNILRRKKKCRVLEVPNLYKIDELEEIRSVTGGLLVQTTDMVDLDKSELEVVSYRTPTDNEVCDLIFAWNACKHVKSNAIVMARNLVTTGIGGGQPNRVQSVEIALRAAGGKAKGSVMASDAFFPFADGVEKATVSGITAIIQPGGSIRDEQVIEAANRSNIAMVFTGRRHFRH
jgi:phosphoribosylaminoimidazolecarboxamide formyltransferase/IMP cyclohydrolase